MQLATLETMVRRLATLAIVPMMLLAVVVPNVSGMANETFEESQSPSESEEEREETREEALISSERRFRSTMAPNAWACDWCNTHQPFRPTHARVALTNAGHRLLHDLLAPMTC